MRELSFNHLEASLPPNKQNTEIKIDDAVNEILKTTKGWIENEQGFINIDLIYGTKKLEITVDPVSGKAWSHLGENNKAKDNDTNYGHEVTPLYIAAKKMIEQEVEKLKQSFEYTFRTVYPRLIRWAEIAGDKIFEWDNRDPKVDDEGKRVFQKQFKFETNDKK